MLVADVTCRYFRGCGGREGGRGKRGVRSGTVRMCREWRIKNKKVAVIKIDGEQEEGRETNEEEEERQKHGGRVRQKKEEE